MRNIVVAAALLAGSVQAQPASIHPQAVAARGLPVRSDTLDGYIVSGARRQFFGYYVHELARTTIGGRAAYFVIMNYRSGGGGFQSDTTALDAASLTPLWRRFHAKVDTISVAYDGRNVVGYAIQNRNGKITRKKISRQVSDSAFSAGMARWFAGGLPLAPGYTFSVTTYSEWSDSEQRDEITVSRSAKVKIGAREVDAWVLTLSNGAERWIDKATGAMVQEIDPRRMGNAAAVKVMRR